MKNPPLWFSVASLGRAVFAAAGVLFCLSLEIETSVAADSTSGETVDFNRDIRGVLSDKCFLCHGPDESTREAGLRLDDRDQAIDAGAIWPGDVDASELIARITSDDPDVVMPPPESGKPVTPAETDRLRRWIASGAKYADHWAFVAPQRPTVPTIPSSVSSMTGYATWPRGDLDRFVLAALASRGSEPSPAASPTTLARRLSLDLTGLPPSIETLDRMQNDSAALDSAALDSLVEDLIASPHFGERWGRWWLDAARYADSAGYEKDMQRQVWFYRDWVIDAMNRDLPYDAFIAHQIAGDLMADANGPNATHVVADLAPDVTDAWPELGRSYEDQQLRVATGFLRNSMTNEEGGADPEQFRVEGMFDRMDAIGKAVLGITTQCAQCHTHKYDPLSHAEYFQMFAALNDFHEASETVYTPDQIVKRDRVLRRIAKVEDEIRTEYPDWWTRVRRWADSAGKELPSWRVMVPTELPFEGQKFRVLDDGSVLSESYAPTNTSTRLSLTTAIDTITAVRVEALRHPQLPRGGPGRSIDGTAALTEFRMRITPVAEGSETINVKFVRATADVNPPKRRLKPQYRRRDPAKDQRVVGPVDFAIDRDDQTAWTTDLGPGRSNRSRHAIFVPESPIVVNGTAKIEFFLDQRHGGWNSDDNQNFLLGRYRLSVTAAATIPDVTVDTAAIESLAKPPSRWDASDWQVLFTAWRGGQPSLAGPNAAIEKLWAEFPITTSQLVARSIGRHRPTHVYTRGDFLRPADRVEPGVPSFLHAMAKVPVDGDAAKDTPVPDRLRFARWLVSKRSPTTARVIVNRIWQSYFGRGLVATPEDFGFQSRPPSHPKLLDFLACELMDHDWSLKHIHRLIVNSATYRQSSAAGPAAWRGDPDNESLARGPRGRVDAEIVRDIALSAGGLLNLRLGGPSVYPPAPGFLFEPPTSYGPKVWRTPDDASIYRRSVYIHQYRSVPYPPLQMFDAPKGDAACVRRERSNTPLQALVMLNEPQFVAAARGLAIRVIRQADTDASRLRLAFRLCTSRDPEPGELEILEDLLDAERQHNTPRSESAAGISDRVAERTGSLVDASTETAGIDPDELAAWIVVCRATLNLDETITKS